jgi:hypothetical protein
MNRKPLLILTSVLTLCVLAVVPAFAQGPVCDGEVSAQGEYEEFGDGWSDHWSDTDNSDGHTSPV